MGTSLVSAPASVPSTTSSTIVIKIGTSSLLNSDLSSIKLSSMARICETVRDLRKEGYKVVLVSSGAVGVGCYKMGLAKRPSSIAQKQALSAVGQVHLMRYYQDFLGALGLTCAQVLLTLNNLSNQGPYLNARNTFQELLNYGTVPIVNENDTIAVEELRFGDNDTLSSQVATLVRADWLFLLTDVDSLYTANPATNPKAVPIPQVHDLNQLKVDTGGKESQWGTGGMVTKLTAARIATAAGCTMVICSSAEPEVMPEIIRGKQAGTVFHPLPNAVRDRKRWILSVPVKGELWLDSGAVAAVRDNKKSLFAAGILKITGDFAAQDAVVLCDSSGYEFARGLCNYTLKEVQKVQGKSSKSFRDELGFVGSEEIIHRNNICLLSVIQSTDSDPNQDGTPVLPTEDEPSPARAPPPLQPHAQAYPPQDYPMGSTGSSGTNIPGLSNSSWPPQQAQQAYQYPTGSQAMHSAQGYGTYGVDGSQAHQGQYQSQPPTYSGQGHGNPQGVQSGWPQSAAPIKQEPPAPSYTPAPSYPPGSSYSSSYPSSTPGHSPADAQQPHTGLQPSANAPYSMQGHNAAYTPFQPSASGAPGNVPHQGMGSGPSSSGHWMQQQGSLGGQPSYAAPAAPQSGPPQGPQGTHPNRDSRGPPPAPKGKPQSGSLGKPQSLPQGQLQGQPQGNSGHRKRQFEAGPPQSQASAPYRHSSYPPREEVPKGIPAMSSAGGGVQDRMQTIRARGRPQEQGTDASMSGGGIQGFKPSASTAWRDSEFARQQHIPAPYNSYAPQQDINEQGWLPR